MESFKTSYGKMYIATLDGQFWGSGRFGGSGDTPPIHKYEPADPGRTERIRKENAARWNFLFWSEKGIRVYWTFDGNADGAGFLAYIIKAIDHDGNDAGHQIFFEMYPDHGGKAIGDSINTEHYNKKKILDGFFRLYRKHYGTTPDAATASNIEKFLVYRDPQGYEISLTPGIVPNQPRQL